MAFIILNGLSVNITFKLTQPLYDKHFVHKSQLFQYDVYRSHTWVNCSWQILRAQRSLTMACSLQCLMFRLNEDFSHAISLSPKFFNWMPRKGEWESCQVHIRLWNQFLWNEQSNRPIFSTKRLWFFEFICAFVSDRVSLCYNSNEHQTNRDRSHWACKHARNTTMTNDEIESTHRRRRQITSKWWCEKILLMFVAMRPQMHERCVKFEFECEWRKMWKRCRAIVCTRWVINNVHSEIRIIFVFRSNKLCCKLNNSMQRRLNL